MNQGTKTIIGAVLIMIGIIFVIRAFYVKDAAIEEKNSKSEFSVSPLKATGKGDDAVFFSLAREARNYQIGGFILIIAGVALLMFNVRRR